MHRLTEFLTRGILFFVIISTIFFSEIFFTISLETERVIFLFSLMGVEAQEVFWILELKFSVAFVISSLVLSLMLLSMESLKSQ